MGNDMYNEDQLEATRDLEAQRDRARLASRLVVAEREIQRAHSLLTSFGVPEQIPPFKTPIAPLEMRLRRFNAMRDQETFAAAKAEQRHAYDKIQLEAEAKRLRWEVARLVVALRPLAALAAVYADLGLDGAAIVTVQVTDTDTESPRNVQLLPAHACAAAATLAEVGS